MLPDEHYFTPHRIVARLQHLLQQCANPELVNWTVTYHKVSRQIVRGVSVQEIRHKVHQWQRLWETEQQSILPFLERQVAQILLQQPFLEDQLAAIIFVSENLLQLAKISPTQVFALFEPVFAGNYISCRLIGDKFGTKILVPLLIREREQTAARLCQIWLPARNLWQARAALTAFSNLAADAIHQEILLYGCSVLVRRPEEEAKMVAGTALRALSKHRPEPVIEFLQHEETLFHFDAQSLLKATSNIENERLVRRVKETRRRVQRTGLDPDTPSLVLPPPQFAGGPAPAVIEISAAMSTGIAGEAGAAVYGLGDDSAYPLGIELGLEGTLGEQVMDVGLQEVDAADREMQPEGGEQREGGEASKDGSGEARGDDDVEEYRDEVGE